MSERAVKQAESDDDNLPVVEHVGHLEFTKHSKSDADVFKTNAEEIKSYSGLSSNAKRRVTNKINKRLQGVGGAESKQVKDKEFLSGYDAFEVVETPYNMDYLAKLYELSPVHYAAVNAKVANIAGLGYKFVETRKTKRTLEEVADNETKTRKLRKVLDEHKDDLLEQIESFNKEDTFTETLIKVWRDYETTGNGYLEIGRKKDGTIGYIGHIPSKTLRIRRARDGFVQLSGFKATFFANFGAGKDDDGKKIPIPNPVGGGTPNEVIHIKKYSPTNTYYGIPDIIAAKHAVAGNEFAARFNLEYFENKAVPRHVIVLKGATIGQAAEQRLLEFFETSLKGQSHRTLFIPLPPSTTDNPVEMEFNDIGSGIEDSSFREYHDQNVSEILMAHRVPITKVSISDSASLAVAKDADKTFKEQVCGPEQAMFEKKLNKVINELTDSYELDLDEMTLMDADTQSQIDERGIKNGWILPNEVRARDGKPGIKGGDERVDPNMKAKESLANQQATRERDSQRSAGRTDSAGAARNPKGEGRTTS